MSGSVDLRDYPGDIVRLSWLAKIRGTKGRTALSAEFDCASR
jgi:hypothetical protein